MEGGVEMFNNPSDYSKANDLKMLYSGSYLHASTEADGFAKKP